VWTIPAFGLNKRILLILYSFWIKKSNFTFHNVLTIHHFSLIFSKCNKVQYYQQYCVVLLLHKIKSLLNFLHMYIFSMVGVVKYWLNQLSVCRNLTELILHVVSSRDIRNLDTFAMSTDKDYGFAMSDLKSGSFALSIYPM
jgi:hypothetical protein